MRFDKLHEYIPYVTGGQVHTVSAEIYPAVKISMPGRHQYDTDPIGGDFVVMVSDFNLGWVNHQFTHDDIFADISKKTEQSKYHAENLFKDYVSVVFGEDPAVFEWHRPGNGQPNGLVEPDWTWHDTLHPQTFLYAVQCLAIAEHRRYHQHESRGGGRFLPARFASGIIEGLWTAEDCKKHQRRGRPGFDMMVKLFGAPKPLKKWNEDEE